MTPSEIAQLVIATFGVVATSTIAWMVYCEGKRQSRISNEARERELQIAYASTQLALLDRRSEVIDNIVAASGPIFTHGEPRDEAVQRLRRALRSAQLVFDEAESEQIKKLLSAAVRWQHFADRCGSGQLPEKIEQGIDDAEDLLIHGLVPLIDALIAAARVPTLPSLQLSKPAPPPIGT